MEKDKTGVRLSSLDGLRGFAIILVFLNHISTTYLSQLIPFNLLGWFLGDGVTGVTFLFILSGFLMALLYPHPASGLGFLQKRYTRIFPLFLSMCLVMFLYHLSPQLSVIFFVLIIGVALVNYLLWVNVFKKLSERIKRSIFIAFLFFQAIIGGIYLLWIMRHPAISFVESPRIFHEGMIFLVNATLTLPLGNYIPMLDGVYWSLVAEVLFYVLYPILVVPLVAFLRPQARLVKVLFLAALFTFIAGITILTRHILVISMIQPALWIYFVVGVVLAHIYKHKPSVLSSLSRSLNFLRWGQLGLFAGVLLLENTFEHSLSGSQGPWIRMVFALPLGLLVLLLLDDSTKLSRFFKAKWLTLLGTISYSVYLSHAIIIHIVEQFFKPTNSITELLFMVSTFGVDLLVASLLYLLLEKPYFTRRAVQQKSRITELQKKTYHPRLISGILSVVYLISIFFVFQSRYNFFSEIRHLPVHSLPDKVVLQGNERITIPFVGNANNLGIIAGTFSHTERRHGSTQTLVFQLINSETNKEVARQTYTLDYFNSGQEFPFGFPTLTDSQNKHYEVVFSLLHPTSPETVTVDTQSLKTIYPANKKELLTHPQRLLTFLQAKVITVVSNSEILSPLLLGVPFFLFTLLSLGKRRAVAIG